MRKAEIVILRGTSRNSMGVSRSRRREISIPSDIMISSDQRNSVVRRRRRQLERNSIPPGSSRQEEDTRQAWSRRRAR